MRRHAFQNLPHYTRSLRPLLPIVAVATAVFLQACSSSSEKPLFTRHLSGHTGVDFNNVITESDSLNILTFEYIYNGGGVGVGDVNNDGLSDLFFTGNMVSCKLYLNQGNFTFKDVTIPAGVQTTAWCTGVAMVDVNQDGLLDISVSTAGPDNKKSTPNLLFINKAIGSDGVPVFEEAAARVGLADSSYTVQTAFLDFDLDGDLDVYLLTNYIERYNRNTPYGQHHDGKGKSVDKLFRNEGVVNGLPQFRDVSREAGILSEGWGLGIVVNDINADGYPDVYVANDFIANDHLYINNGNGTFTNDVARYFKHQEHDGMGVDIADINNDNLNDIIALDMMPEDNQRQKAMFSNIGYDRFHLNRKRNYQTQYVRNVLQLNNGNGTFSDIGYLAGVYATDWSWSSLLADVDNDGYRDLFITNGFRKDITDLDFVSYSKEAKMFGSPEHKFQKTLEALSTLEGVKKPNYLYRNNGDLRFTNQAASWGLEAPSYSTGAAYADLDNDGDLDLVVNNINDEAFLYENKLETTNDGHNFVRVRFRSRTGGLGARVWVYAGGVTLYAEHQAQRGYQSSVDPVEHFGLGKINTIDSMKIVWPQGKEQTLHRVSVNTVVDVNDQDAAKPVAHSAAAAQTIFAKSDPAVALAYLPEESDFVDYKQGQPLLLHKHSQAGPAVAVGDMNNDGLEDVVLGAPAGKPTTIFFQQRAGTFRIDSLPPKPYEDAGVLLLDVDNDGDLDLYTVSGSSEFGLKTEYYQDRLYRNDGRGNFRHNASALPVIQSSGSCVTACDFDKDNDLDLFVGGRVVPTRFPQTPKSYILQNDGAGNFEDIANRFPEIEYAGMVTAALWTDFDNDGWTDLALAGEWMPVTFFKNNSGKTFSPGYASPVGWWNSLTAGDADNDGDTDYVIGNVGLNSLYQASEAQPVSLYAKDFDNNGSIDPVVTRYIQGKEYPTHYRESMTEQMAGLRRTLTSYAAYGAMTFGEIISPQSLKDAQVFHAAWLASAYLENLGNGAFRMAALPVQAQLSPLFGLKFSDINNDGNLDILGIGNSYAAETITGWYDAGIGVCLYGNGAGSFKPVHTHVSGFFADKDAKALAVLHHASGKMLWLATNNQDSLQVFEQARAEGALLIEPRPDDAFAEIFFSSGKKQRHEFYRGEGYISQSSQSFYVPAAAREIVITSTSGAKRRVQGKAMAAKATRPKHSPVYRRQ